MVFESSSSVALKPFKTGVLTLFLATFFLAAYLIFVLPLASTISVPTSHNTTVHDESLDQQSARPETTNHAALDNILTSVSAVVDGTDEALRLFTLWFTVQLAGVLVFTFWESGRVEKYGTLVQAPMLVCIMAQLATGGVVIPLYFWSFVRNMDILAAALPRNAASRARTLFPAVLLGFTVPSAALFLVPSSVSLHAKQVLSAIWQPFPIYITVLWHAFRRADVAIIPRVPSSTAEARQTLSSLKFSYYGCAALCTATHLAIVIPSIFAPDPSTSFAHIFLPLYTHKYLSNPPATGLSAWRISMRLLLQHDWLFMTIAELIFFAWHQYASRAIPMRSWMLRMAVLSAIGGPGTAVAWAAFEREKWIFAPRRESSRACKLH